MAFAVSRSTASFGCITTASGSICEPVRTVVMAWAMLSKTLLYREALTVGGVLARIPVRSFHPR